MPASELAMWALYLEARPIGWKEDLRTSYIMRSMGAKSSGDQVFNSLAQINKWDKESDSVDKLQSSIASSVFGQMLGQHNIG